MLDKRLCLLVYFFCWRKYFEGMVWICTKGMHALVMLDGWAAAVYHQLEVWADYATEEEEYVHVFFDLVLDS